MAKSKSFYKKSAQSSLKLNTNKTTKVSKAKNKLGTKTKGSNKKTTTKDLSISKIKVGSPSTAKRVPKKNPEVVAPKVVEKNEPKIAVESPKDKTFVKEVVTRRPVKKVPVLTEEEQEAKNSEVIQNQLKDLKAVKKYKRDYKEKVTKDISVPLVEKKKVEEEVKPVTKPQEIEMPKKATPAKTTRKTVKEIPIELPKLENEEAPKEEDNTKVTLDTVEINDILKELNDAEKESVSKELEEESKPLDEVTKSALDDYSDILADLDEVSINKVDTEPKESAKKVEIPIINIEEDKKPEFTETREFDQEDIDDVKELSDTSVKVDTQDLEALRREIEKPHLKKAKEEKVKEPKEEKTNKKKPQIISIVYSLLSLIPVAFLLFSIHGLGIKSNRIMIACGIYIVVELLFIFLVMRRNKFVKTIGFILLTLLIGVSILGSYYVHHTNKFLNSSFGSRFITSTSTYYIISNKENGYDDKNLFGDLNTYKNTVNLDKALTYLSNYEFNIVSYDDISALISDVNTNTIKLALVEKSMYETIIELDKEINADNIQILKTFEIEVKTETQPIEASNSYNIYVSGQDFAKFTDFNMIITINETKHKILLTSIPRDYYLQVPGYPNRDKLSFMGTYGELNTQNAIAEAFDIDINYSVKVTDESLVKVVDTLGGIEYCSDVAYTTTHAVVIDTYDDTKGSKLYVKAGCQKLNGLETLTVARERNAFPGRDRQRQKNVQNIMESILKKVASFNTLSNYNKVLDSISGLYTTNIPREKITNLAEVTIDGAKWTVEKQSVDGQDTQGFVYQSNKIQDWIMIPDESTIEEAKKNIQAIMS